MHRRTRWLTTNRETKEKVSDSIVHFPRVVKRHSATGSKKQTATMSKVSP